MTKLYTQRGAIAEALAAALRRGVDDPHLISEARGVIKSRPSADDDAKRVRILRQLREAPGR